MAWDSAETINRKYDSPLELFILLGFAIKYGKSHGCGISFAYLIVEIVFLVIIAKVLDRLDEIATYSGMIPFVVLLIIAALMMLLKNRECRLFGFTSATLCIIILIVLSIPQIKLDFAKKKVASVYKESIVIRDNRSTEYKDVGFMNVLIGYDQQKINRICSEDTNLCFAERSWLSYEDTIAIVSGVVLTFDTVLQMKALWDNRDVYIRVFLNNDSVCMVAFKTDHDIIDLFEKKYGKSEKYGESEKIVVGRFGSPIRLRYKDGHNKYPYYYYDKNAYDIYQWTFKNATIRINNNHAYNGFSYEVQYFSSSIANKVDAQLERKRQIEKQKQIEAEKERKRKEKEEEIRRQNDLKKEIMEKKRREMSHQDAIKNI